MLPSSLVLAAALLTTQQPAFLHTITPGGARTLVTADVSYGERLFSGIGPERWEQRFGAQLALGTRFTLVAAAGFATRTSGSVELLANVLPKGSRAYAALGLGGMTDYSGCGVALGRVTAGIRGPLWQVAGNLRLERSLAAASAQRDALDVITSFGVSRRFGGPLRVGLEAVGEDLEGIFDPNEAEGGAKLLVGPTIAIAPNSRWQFVLGGGPVLRLSQSTVILDGGGSVPRDLTTRSGYVIRSSVAFTW